jgi:antitoxin PrlF
MQPILEAESTLTDRFQTTVPEAVRRVLQLDKRDKIHYDIRANGEVTLTRVNSAEDPVLGEFLDFLARDLSRNPEQIKAIDADLVDRIRLLTRGVEVHIDAALSPDDE